MNNIIMKVIDSEKEGNKYENGTDYYNLSKYLESIYYSHIRILCIYLKYFITIITYELLKKTLSGNGT